MTNAPAGWYSVADEPGILRWWDGTRWTEHRTAASAASPPSAAAARALMSRGAWFWLLGTGVGFLLACTTWGIGPAMVLLAVFAVVAAIVALVADRVSWLRTLTWKLATLGAGFILLIGGSAATAASAPRSPAALVDLTSASASPHASPAEIPDAPTPVVAFREDRVTEAIPFERTTQDDPTRDVGTTAVVQAGVDGVRTLTYRVTFTDGVETARSVIDSTITRSPVPEITAIGSRQPAPPPGPAPGGGGGAAGCDPNYSGACVPIASDVDCAGGGGNGPAYVRGPVHVIGIDIYDLDRDGDGIACDR
jgi:hypothetical protein